MRSFDTVSIDSDLDSVCTEQVRQHIHRLPGKTAGNVEESELHFKSPKRVHM